MKPPLSIDGTTAMHFADSMISSGIPLSGVPMISVRTVAAASMRCTSSDESFLSSPKTPGTSMHEIANTATNDKIRRLRFTRISSQPVFVLALSPTSEYQHRPAHNGGGTED